MNLKKTIGSLMIVMSLAIGSMALAEIMVPQNIVYAADIILYDDENFVAWTTPQSRKSGKGSQMTALVGYYDKNTELKNFIHILSIRKLQCLKIGNSGFLPMMLGSPQSMTVLLGRWFSM